MLVPKESIQKMAPYVGPGEGRLDALRLDFNENLLGASPKVMEALRNVSREQCGCYPEYGELNQALSKYLGVPEQCLVASNGSDEALKAVFDTFLEKGDEVVLLAPSYSMYEIYAHVAGANIVTVFYRPDDFIFPIEEILRAIKPDTKLIALANPNNPTGTLIGRDDLIRIIEANPRMAVIIDEAYAPFARTTNIDLIGLYPNVFITQTFSKAHGLAGLRFGYLISTPENIAAISKVLSPSYSVDCIAAAAARAAIEDIAYVDAYVDQVIAARDDFVKEIAVMGFTVIPSQANFVLIQIGNRASEVREVLRKNHILVRERADLKGYLRITIGPNEYMQKVLDILRKMFLKEALIFDMDGVLIDESKSYRQCIKKTAEYFLGFPIKPEQIETLKQNGGFNNDYDCTDAILRNYGVNVKRGDLIARFDLYYEELKFLEEWLVDENILLKLKAYFRLGIFTGRPKRDALDALSRFKKETLFDAVITDDDVRQRKPKPEGLFMAIDQLQACKAIYIGDSKDDREAAASAGVKFVEVVPPGCGIAEILGRLLCEKET